MTGVAFHIGGLTIGWYGIMIASGVLAAIGIALIEARRRGENTRHIVNMAQCLDALGHPDRPLDYRPGNSNSYYCNDIATL